MRPPPRSTLGYPASLLREAQQLYVEERLSCRRVVEKLRERHGWAPSQQCVFEHLRRRGVLRSRSDADRAMNERLHGKDYRTLAERARQLAEDHYWSPRAIARHLGVSKGMVRRTLEPHQQPGPAEAIRRRAWDASYPDVRARLRRRIEVLRRRRAGETYDAIAAALGVSRSTIYHYCRAAKLTRPLRGRGGRPWVGSTP